MDNEQKMNWVRAHWTKLKKKGQLEEAIAKIQATDDFLNQYIVQDIIDIEESMPSYLK